MLGWFSRFLNRRRESKARFRNLRTALFYAHLEPWGA